MWWLPAPTKLFTDLSERLDLRDSLFPVLFRSALPSFYFWDFWSYLTYLPNLMAYAAFVGLVVIGARVGPLRAISKPQLIRR